jgi:glutathione S-transferase
MLTVHHLETSRSQRILWLLEELGVPYELEIYRRNKVTRLAPPELKKVHPLGKSPVEKYGDLGTGELAHLQPSPGTPEARQCRFWMHYAEGSLMNWLVMKLVFVTIPTQPMPFLVRPVARTLCGKVQAQLIDPNLQTAAEFIEDHLSRHRWFLGAQHG